jgi:predicted RNase H-like nuclease (RuvC/YqgF family)
MTHDIDTRDQIIADLSARLEAAEAEVERLWESLAQARGEIERLISVSKYEERETAEAKAEVERLKTELREASKSRA